MRANPIDDDVHAAITNTPRRAGGQGAFEPLAYRVAMYEVKNLYVLAYNLIGPPWVFEGFSVRRFGVVGLGFGVVRLYELLEGV